MNLLYVVVVAFIVLEFYKLINWKSILVTNMVMSLVAKISDRELRAKLIRPHASRLVFFVFADTIYLLFCFVLLFTAYWHIGIILLSMTLLKSLFKQKTEAGIRVLSIADSLLSIVVLSSVIML